MSGGRRSQSNKNKTPEQRQLEEMRKKMAELEKENKLQQAQLQAAKKSGKSGKRGKYVAKIPMNKDLEKKIQTISGAQGPTLWRTTKFLNTDDDIYLATKTIMADLPECKKLLEGDPATVEENILAFKDTYQGAITTGINEQRNNTQTGLKNAYIERYDNQEDMPTPNDLLKVILRRDLAYPERPKEPTEADFPEKPDKYAQAKTIYEQKMQKYLAKRKEVKKNRGYFKWYWTCLLPKVCGNKRWSVTIRNYGTISGHAPVDTPKKKYVTTSDEALVQVLFENCGQRFPYLASLERRKYTKEEKQAQREHKEYTSQYSSATVGQEKFGGWNALGRKRYYDLCVHIREVRRDPETLALELEILEEIQADYGLDKKKEKKRKAPPLLDLSKTEGFFHVCCESDEYDSDDEALKKQKEQEILPFVANYQAPAEKKKRKKKTDSDEDEDSSEE
jgi:hypothetical protein